MRGIIGDTRREVGISGCMTASWEFLVWRRALVKAHRITWWLVFEQGQQVTSSWFWSCICIVPGDQCIIACLHELECTIILTRDAVALKEPKSYQVIKENLSRSNFQIQAVSLCTHIRLTHGLGVMALRHSKTRVVE